MKAKRNSTAGPFEIIDSVETVDAPLRQLDCLHYEECLNLAAALNWQSFTCSNCRGTVNSSLVWRAHICARKDAVVAKLCSLPRLVSG